MRSTTSDPAARADDVPELVDRLFRRESARLVASLTRAFGPGNLQLAEDVVQESLVRALQLWPYRGIPENPRAWLTRVARNRGIDALRRRQTWSDKEQVLARLEALDVAPPVDPGASMGDDELTMLFLCCHPSLSRQDQVALTLKVAGGLSATEIAQALLGRRKAIEQRLVRAKRRLRQDSARFEMPSPMELAERLGAVLEVLYLIFTEGYASSTHSDWIRAELSTEALRQVELLCGRPGTDGPSTRALAALFCFQAARFPARVDGHGSLVELEDQDRRLWDQQLIARGLLHFERSAAGSRVTRYHVEAELAAHWALEPRPDWSRVLALYEELAALSPSPVVAVHAAVARARSGDPESAHRELEQLSEDKRLREYVPFHVARGEVALSVGALDTARAAFDRVLRLTGDNALHERMVERLRDLS